VWHAAILPRLKKFPKYSEFVEAPKTAPKPRQARRLSPEEMLSMARRWTVATGGELDQAEQQ
jgi:hypothetical protein